VAHTVVDTNPHEGDPNRRDFIHIAAATAAVGAVGAAVWPLVDQMNPSGDVLALASIEFDLSKVMMGQQVVVKWQGKPVFVRYRTPKEIAEAVADEGPGHRRQPPQGRQVAMADPGRRLHPPGLRAELRRRRLRRLAVPLPRLGLRHVRPHP
jgi:hypothetical protein